METALIEDTLVFMRYYSVEGEKASIVHTIIEKDKFPLKNMRKICERVIGNDYEAIHHFNNSSILFRSYDFSNTIAIAIHADDSKNIDNTKQKLEELFGGIELQEI